MKVYLVYLVKRKHYGILQDAPKTTINSLCLVEAGLRTLRLPGFQLPGLGFRVQGLRKGRTALRGFEKDLLRFERASYEFHTVLSWFQKGSIRVL